MNNSYKKVTNLVAPVKLFIASINFFLIKALKYFKLIKKFNLTFHKNFKKFKTVQTRRVSEF